MINDGTRDEYTVAFDGNNFPNVHKYLVAGLKTGEQYSFVVQALNFNGASESSDPMAYIICQFLLGLSCFYINDMFLVKKLEVLKHSE